MTRRLAPRDFGGRLLRKEARTTPLLPRSPMSIIVLISLGSARAHTVCPSDFAPDDSQVAASNGLLCAVDVGDFLAEVKAGQRVNIPSLV